MISKANQNDGFWELGGYRKLRPALKLSPYNYEEKGHSVNTLLQV